MQELELTVVYGIDRWDSNEFYSDIALSDSLYKEIKKAYLEGEGESLEDFLESDLLTKRGKAELAKKLKEHNEEVALAIIEDSDEDGLETGDIMMRCDIDIPDDWEASDTLDQ